MAAKTTRVALIQMSCEASTEANLAKAVARVREAAENGATLICLPELFRAQYFCQREDHALFDITESIPGPSTAALAEVVREYKLVVVASLFERRAPGLYHNTAAILDHASSNQDCIADVYRKMHIPDDPLYYEKFYFTPGDLGFKTQRTSAGPIGTLVCWDQWYPEGARVTALKGAETLFFPTAIGWHPSEKEEFGERQYDAWQTIQRGHAIANGVFVCSVNRVGHEQGDVEHNGVMMKGPEGAGLEFWGGSFIADPFGRILAKASHDKEEILYADLDAKEVEITRQHWPFLRDRRIDAYGGITSRFLD
ncbi:carbon-nitrogen hydrolase [Granulicella cerasi]|uniref:Carbon-nitrogen hydrolase n=1 Tax=Granulicella cerasi TaxID=741063 RepID=A0ABW1Z7L1_9BACT|nr:carbon-nitrogen hydrolase [Granulicella cerasi]